MILVLGDALFDLTKVFIVDSASSILTSASDYKTHSEPSSPFPTPPDESDTPS